MKEDKQKKRQTYKLNKTTTTRTNMFEVEREIEREENNNKR